MNKSAVLVSASTKFLWQQQPISSLGISLAGEGNGIIIIIKKKSLNQKRFVKLRTASPSPISFFRKCPLFLIVCEDVLLNSTHCLRQNKTNKKALNKQQFFCPSKSERERDHKHADWRCIGGMNMAVAVHTASR